MASISLTNRLRPIRFGFLARIGNKQDLNKILQLNTMLWGGRFNPIIPIFDKTPIWWDRRGPKQESAKEIIKGYLKFFEPDFIVEPKERLAKDLNIPSDRVISLAKFYEDNRGEYYTPQYGLNNLDIYRELYNKEYKFVSRHDRNVISVKSESKDELFLGVVFGIFPKHKKLSYVRQAYFDAFDPEIVNLNSKTLEEIYYKRATSPLRMGNYKLDIRYEGMGEPRLFILDVTNINDLIDLWNLRAYQSGVVAIPVQWIDDLTDFCKKFISDNYRPLPGNRHGVMIRTTVEFGRSIIEARASELFNKYIKTDEPGAVLFQPFYHSFWNVYEEDYVYRSGRPLVTCDEVTSEHEISEKDIYISFKTRSPDFAKRYANKYRWANCIRFSQYLGDDRIATVFPYGDYSKVGFFKHYEKLISSTEGLIIFPRYHAQKEMWAMENGSDVFDKWFKSQNIISTQSEAGSVLSQIVNSLGSLRELSSIAHPKIIKLLNKMAHKAIIIKTDTGEEIKHYEGRSATLEEWRKLLKQLNQDSMFSHFSTKDLIDGNVVQLGLSLNCEHCNTENWYSMSNVDYTLQCERCTRIYNFPKEDNIKSDIWQLRVIGPFATPNYARGSYSAALSIRVFSDC